MTANETITETKSDFLNALRDKLEEISETGSQEVYLHDIGHHVVDKAISLLGQVESVELIEYTGNEQYADKDVLDTSSVNRFITTMAYECLYHEIFDDNVFQELQDKLNNEVIDYENAQGIIKYIDQALVDLS